jgi:alkylation response protein AidB-like acyl-CoA dehydrogenase
VVPAAAVTVHDNWHVAGLEGTGSGDISLADVFVPEAFTWDLAAARPRRGGPLYRLGLPAFVANEHAAFAVGVARRALAAAAEQAAAKARGLSKPALVAARPAFQSALARSDLALRAARALADQVFERAWAAVGAGGAPDLRLQAECRACATYATDVALEAVSAAFRHAGGSALYRSNPLQRCLRDLQAAAQHFAVADSAYEGLGQVMLGIPGASPMA